MNEWTQRCVLALLKQAPEALSKRNAKNFMFPFMTAASVHDDNKTKARHKYGERQMLQRKLELTYAVLREDPSVVAVGITESRHEKYLKTKLEVHSAP